MKVLQINAVGKTGSTGRTTWEMHEYFDAHGIENYIATATGAECAESFAISTQKGIYVDIALSILSGLEAYHSRQQTKRLLRYLDDLRPDIVHLRNLHQSYIHLNMLLDYLASRDIATVVTLHDFWFLTGKCCSPDLYECKKWTTGCNRCPALEYDAHKRLFDQTAKMWKDKKQRFAKIPRLAVIGNSQWTTRNAQQSILSCAKIVDFIYNWIDQTIFYPQNAEDLRQQYNLKNKKIIIAVASYWSQTGSKGLNHYIALSKAIPDDWQIVLIGKVIAGVELPNKILHITTVTEAEQLARWYSLADVYLNLSQSETFGKAAAEALCCGTPLIAINTTANPELIPTDGGILLQTTDIEEIISAIRKVFLHDKAFYSEKCRLFCKERFDKKKNIERYIKIYDRLMANYL